MRVRSRPCRKAGQDLIDIPASNVSIPSASSEAATSPAQRAHSSKLTMDNEQGA
jgi:hypothetical protein